MRHVYRLILLSLLLAGLLAVLPTASAQTIWTIPLMAGQFTEIGYVEFTLDGSNLTATYQVNATGWCLQTTHLYIGSTPPEQSAPGQFPYIHEGLGCVASDSYAVIIDGFTIYAAAHANAHYSEQLADPLSVPEGTVDFFLTNPGPVSYFQTTTAGIINGTFDGWCVDTDRHIISGATYTADPVSSYDPNLPAGLVEYPHNFDLVNYIMNQNYVGQGYTYSEVQRAIWTLIDDYTSTAGLGPWTQENVDAILQDALTNGEGFVPGCGQVMAVILNPLISGVQITVIPQPVPCLEPEEKDETAWAIGSGMIAFDTGWGGYFLLQSQPEEDLTVWGPEIEVPIDDQQDDPPPLPEEDETSTDEGTVEEPSDDPGETPDETEPAEPPVVEEPPVDETPTDPSDETSTDEQPDSETPAEDQEWTLDEDTDGTAADENPNGRPDRPASNNQDGDTEERPNRPERVTTPNQRAICGAVAMDTVTLYAEPNTASTILSYIPARAALFAYEQQGDWLKVNFVTQTDTVTGWISLSGSKLRGNCR
jgi:hypothetical protein